MNLFSRAIRFACARYAPRGARITFAQCGEDLAILTILSKKGIKNPSYIDIGTHHPIFGNNTYLFYRKGGKGVLVEPNPVLCEVIRNKRPKDICVNAGVGAKDGEADFYAFSQSTRSTFSASQARSWEASSGQKATVEKRKILSLDTIIREHCEGKAPDIVSIDAEGLDEIILNNFSWSTRPKVFCIESSGTVDKLMRDRGYELVAQIFHNAIFVDKNN